MTGCSEGHLLGIGKEPQPGPAKTSNSIVPRPAEKGEEEEFLIRDDAVRTHSVWNNPHLCRKFTKTNHRKLALLTHEANNNIGALVTCVWNVGYLLEPGWIMAEYLQGINGGYLFAGHMI